jgi:hypothetical protein
VGVPAAHAVNVHPGVPARPSGQSSTQLEPAAQLAEQLWSTHENRQVLPGPHVQLPFAHSPSHSTLSPAQRTWHGPELHVSSQLAPRSHVQVPFAHCPEQSAPGSQATWQGGLWHAKSQRDPSPHEQSPFAHSPSQRGLSPKHSRWHGGAAQSATHSSPKPHAHVSFAHTNA